MRNGSAEQQGWRWALVMAVAVRALVACVAEDQWGDAPARLEFVDRWIASPGVYWDFTKVGQFGPLPTNVAGALGLLLGSHAAARLVVLVAGVAAVPLAGALAARFGGPAAGAVAAWALALSPLHIQSSTTFVSEAIYVAFALGAVLRALAGDPWGMTACAFGASTTRYDTWLWLPLLGAWWWLRAPVASRGKRVAGFLLLGAGPISILLANALAGDPLKPLTYISNEHGVLAAAAQARWGAAQWRVGMLFFWPVALLVVATPGFGIALFYGLFHAIRERSAALAPASIGAFAPVLYTFRSIVLGTFWPMTRFAIGPAALLLAAAPALNRRALAHCIVLALLFNVGLAGLASNNHFANAISPVSRLDDELRAGVEAARASALPVVLDVSPNYEEIIVSCHARVDRWNATHPPEALVRARLVTFEGGALDRLLADQGTWRGVSYVQRSGAGRVRWWDPAP